jgi:CDP-glucose 4,6-dehydratase
MQSLFLNRDFWHGRRVLLTGHTGFKGAWTALWLQRLGANVFGLALPPEEPSLYRLLGLESEIPSRYVDLADSEGVRAAIKEARPQLALHMAAQALVPRSLEDPVETFTTNVVGTVNLLQALRSAPDLTSVLVVTSDKVYADEGADQAHKEGDRLGGLDPYSASKAACEIATASMADSFLRRAGVKVATARGGNVVGGGDFSPQRLVPDIVRAAVAGETLALRRPNATRPWQHVLDCVSGYLSYLAALDAGVNLPNALNFGPRSARGKTVAELAEALQSALGAADGWVFQPEEQSRERQTLAIDSNLARATLNWRDCLHGDEMVASIAEWYGAWARGEDPRAVSLRQIEDYEARCEAALHPPSQLRTSAG